MEELDQLALFKQQIGPKRPLVPDEKEEVVSPAGEVHAVKGRKRKKDKDGKVACIRITQETLRKAKTLGMWMTAHGIRSQPSLVELVDEAFDYLIENKYPQMKKFIIK